MADRAHEDVVLRLTRAGVPDAAGAQDRARVVVLAAAAERPQAPRRVSRAVVALAAALAIVVAGALTPPGDAVATWVKDLVTTTPAPAPRPALSSLPAGGRLLVTGRGGTWVVRGDGSRRRLGPYGDAAWSPHGLFVAVTRGRTLLAVEPRGTVRWALARPATVHDPRWQPTTGYRIAYRSAGRLRVVAGDGSGDHALPGRVAAVAAAWRPGRRNVLALARPGGVVEVWDADTRVRLQRHRVVDPIALAWSRHRLVVIRRAGVTVLGPRGRHAIVAAGRIHAAALSPDGRRLALLRGGALRVTGLDGRHARTVYSAPARLGDVTWSPDGHGLLVTVPAADQWLFLPLAGAVGLVADGDIAAQFDPARRVARGFPSVAGWTP